MHHIHTWTRKYFSSVTVAIKRQLKIIFSFKWPTVLVATQQNYQVTPLIVFVYQGTH